MLDSPEQDAERAQEQEAVQQLDGRLPPADCCPPPAGRATPDVGFYSDASTDGLSSGDESERHLPFPGFPETVYRCLKQTNPARYWCLRLLTWPWFERIVIAVIVVNCITLAMYQPCTDLRGCTSARCKTLEAFDYCVFVFFLAEMSVKLLSMGLYGPGSYLADAWNRFDLFIVIAGIVEIGVGEAAEINFSAIRTVRVLRPLRAINRIPNLRILVMLLLDTLPMLANVLFICFFVFFIFGILGVQLWAGVLRQRCFIDNNGPLAELNMSSVSKYYAPHESGLEYVCTLQGMSGMLSCRDIGPVQDLHGVPCAGKYESNSSEAIANISANATSTPDVSLYNSSVGGGTCINWNQYYTDCRADGPNPFLGAISFDNIAYAWIAIFQVISLEGWVDIMYYLQDSQSFWVWIYFVSLIVIGSFFMINLFLVVIATQFSETKRRETQKMLQERRRFVSSSTLTSATRLSSEGCYTGLLKYAIHVCRAIRRRTRSFVKLRRRQARALGRTPLTLLRGRGEKGDTKRCGSGTGLCGGSSACDHDDADGGDEGFGGGEAESSTEGDYVEHAAAATEAAALANGVSHGGRCPPCLHRAALAGGDTLSQQHEDCCSLQHLGAPVASPERSEVCSAVATGCHAGGGGSPGPFRAAHTTGGGSPGPLRAAHTTGGFWPRSVSGTLASADCGASTGRLLSSSDSGGYVGVTAGADAGETPLPGGKVVSAAAATVESDPPPSPSATPLAGDAVPASSQRRPYEPEAERLRVLLERLPGPPRPLTTSHRPTDTSDYSHHHHHHQGSENESPEDDRFSAAEAAACASASGAAHKPAWCDARCPQCQSGCLLRPRKRRRKKKKSVKHASTSNRKHSGLVKCLADKVSMLRCKVRRLTESQMFSYAIMAAILVNSCSMGVEHHKQPESLTRMLEYSNMVFIGIFTAEMLLKVFAIGFLGYIRSAFNVFDAFIVSMSFAELAMGGSSGLSVLRTFRLLRIMRLLRFLPALQRQVVVMLRTMDNVTTFFWLLVLFIFIFSILGMNLFGCRLCAVQEKCSRRNFDSLLWALVTVFQILTQADWNLIMYEGMAATSPWAALYFVALMTLGNYVLFNLLVAILVEGFSSMRNEVRSSQGSLKETVENKDEEDRTTLIRERSSSDSDGISSFSSKELGHATQISVQQPLILISSDSTDEIARGETELEVSRCNGFATRCNGNAEVQRSASFHGIKSQQMQFLESALPSAPGSPAVAATLGNMRQWQDISWSSLMSTTDCNSTTMGGGDSVCYLDPQRSPCCSEPSQLTLSSCFLTPPRQPLWHARRSSFRHHSSSSSSSSGGSDRLPEKRADAASDQRAGVHPANSQPIVTVSGDLSSSHVAAVPALARPEEDDDDDDGDRAAARRGDFSATTAEVASGIASTDTSARPVAVEFAEQLLRLHGSALLADCPKKSNELAERNLAKNNALRKVTASPTCGCQAKHAAVDKAAGLCISCRLPESSVGAAPLALESVFRAPSMLLLPKMGGGSAVPTGRTAVAAASASGGCEGGSALWPAGGCGGSREQLNNSRKSPAAAAPTAQTASAAVDSASAAVAAATAEASQAMLLRSIMRKAPAAGCLDKVNNNLNGKLSGRSRTNGSSAVAVAAAAAAFVQPSPDGLSAPAAKGHRNRAASLLRAVKRAAQQVNVKKQIRKLLRPRGCLAIRHRWSLYLLAPDNKLRRLCVWLCTKRWFDYVVLSLIALNCITLAVERPSIPEHSVERKILDAVNDIFTAAFTLEMLIKVLAYGLIIGPGAYLRSGWNIMDGFLVLVSIVSTIVMLTASGGAKIFGVLRVLRLLRALRPLRVISRAQGLKLVVETLLASLRPIGNVVVICMAFFLIFGILGVQLFKGTFWRCVGPDLTNVTDRVSCLTNPENKWVNEKYNFDDLGKSLMTLFVLSSKDGWIGIMYPGLDAVDVDKQPIENYNEWRMIYFISFLLLVGFFVLNMFVGVVVENFHRCREVQEKEEKERRLAKLNKKLQRKSTVVKQRPYWHNYSPRRRMIHSMMMNKYLDVVVTVVICLNIISMAVEHYNMPQDMVTALRILNYVFTFAFIMESILKLIALGLVRYVRDRWNLLDSGIVMLSIGGIALEEIQSGVMPINPTIIRVMRILRVARVLKLVKTAKGIRALLDTVLVALPQIGNLGLLFFLLFYIFAALGVELFGRLPDCSSMFPCEGMGVHANFKNFGMAFLTLFRIATGDNWNGIMKDALREDCVEGEDCLVNCCANKIITPIFFVIFVLTAQFVLVNVVVAVLMKQLEESGVSIITFSTPDDNRVDFPADDPQRDERQNEILMADVDEEAAAATYTNDEAGCDEADSSTGRRGFRRSSGGNCTERVCLAAVSKESTSSVAQEERRLQQPGIDGPRANGKDECQTIQMPQQPRRALSKQLSLPSDFTYRPYNR